MAGIVAALEAHDDVGLFGQPVDDLALALVAPLGPDHNYICHERPLTRADGPRSHAAPLPRRTKGWASPPITDGGRQGKPLETRHCSASTNSAGPSTEPKGGAARRRSP